MKEARSVGPGSRLAVLYFLDGVPVPAQDTAVFAALVVCAFLVPVHISAAVQARLEHPLANSRIEADNDTLRHVVNDGIQAFVQVSADLADG